MSSLNLNKVVLCGRLTADPELKQTGSGIAVVTFTLAVNRRFQARSGDAAAQQQADFITLVTVCVSSTAVAPTLSPDAAKHLFAPMPATFP